MIRVSPLPVVPDLPQPGRTLVMGVVNVTPDSFSDGGDWFDPAAAITHGMELLSEGADIIDVGGESTRPGAVRPEVSEELRRVLPVVRELAAAGACVSIDTMRAAVAEPAIAAGARLVNDVSGGRSDPGMLRLVADAGVCYVCMHWRGHSEDMQSKASYADVVAEVIAELRTQLEEADRAGVASDKLIIDPGFGFAKTGEHNWQLLSASRSSTSSGDQCLPASLARRFLAGCSPALMAAHGRPSSGTTRQPRSSLCSRCKGFGVSGCTRSARAEMLLPSRSDCDHTEPYVRERRVERRRCCLDDRAGTVGNKLSAASSEEPAVPARKTAASSGRSGASEHRQLPGQIGSHASRRWHGDTRSSGRRAAIR